MHITSKAIHPGLAPYDNRSNSYLPPGVTAASYFFYDYLHAEEHLSYLKINVVHISTVRNFH